MNSPPASHAMIGTRPKRPCCPLFNAAALVSALCMSACALPPQAIEPGPVSIYSYRSFNCQSIELEIDRVHDRVMAITHRQKLHAVKDAAALGAALFFWPALFVLQENDSSHELARLKGEFEALEYTAQRKDCDVARQIALARKAQQEQARWPLPASVPPDSSAPADGAAGGPQRQGLVTHTAVGIAPTEIPVDSPAGNLPR